MCHFKFQHSPPAPAIVHLTVLSNCALVAIFSHLNVPEMDSSPLVSFNDVRRDSTGFTPRPI